MFNIDLKDKAVAITGASQGIGKAIAEVFAQNGANVILLARNKTKLEENIKVLKNARYFILDVSKTDDVEKIFKQIGHIDILINNAGIHFNSPVHEMKIEDWKNLLAINLDGSMYSSRAVLSSMIKNNWGRIINISSVCGKFGYAYESAYTASKFGLIGFTQSLAQEVAKFGITANCICPGWVETKMAEAILHDEDYAKLYNIPLEKLETTSLQAVPIERYIQPKEVANLALYLASDYASAITGQAINICGGLVMH